MVIGWCGMFTKRLFPMLYEYAMTNGNGSLFAVSYNLNSVPTGIVGIECANVTTWVSPRAFLMITS